MNFDCLALAAVAAEIRALTGCRAGRASQPEPDRVILPLRSPGRGRDLLLCAHPRYARVQFTVRPAAQPSSPAAQPGQTTPEPSAFLSLLRRRLDGARLAAVDQPHLERILRLEFAAVDEVKGLVRLVLVAEVMGKHSNLVLLDGSGTVLDALKRVTRRVNRYREVLPGRPYLAPPSRPGLDPLGLDPAGLESALRDFPAPTGNVSLQDWLLSHTQGLSPVLAREVAARAGLDPDGPAALALRDPLRLAPGLKWLQGAVRQVLTEGRAEPTGYLDPEGRLAAFSALPLCQFAAAGLSPRPYPDMGTLLDEFYQGREQGERLEQARQGLSRRLEAAIGRLGRRLALQERAAASGAEAERLREWGEIITAHLHELSPGAASARLARWDGSGQPQEVEVPLDPRLSPAANAQAYFARYRKLKAAAQGASRQAEATRRELEYLEGTAHFLCQARALEEVEELERELSRAGYVEAAGAGAEQAGGGRAAMRGGSAGRAAAPRRGAGRKGR
ncbi:MAG: NFACT family protein, partial [Acetobacteraceae bacterium]|nr:NFACT family protein [Acetobacteraceae bacterium]